MPNIKILGTTDEVTTCDCCGKKNLKNTVAFSIDDSEPIYYGVVCASRIYSRPPKEIKSEARKADIAKRKSEAAAFKAKQDAEFKEWKNWLMANTSVRNPNYPDDIFTMIQSLGGYTVAREKFEASKK